MKSSPFELDPALWSFINIRGALVYILSQLYVFSFFSFSDSGPIKVVEWGATPRDFLVQYNSTFDGYVLLQGLPHYRPDLEILDWRTQSWSSANASKASFIDSGFVKVTFHYSQLRCLHTGYHRLVVEKPDYTQFIYRFPDSIQLSGKGILLYSVIITYRRKGL